MDLPYLVEYAKSGRATCKGCKNIIEKDTLRLAVMVQSAFHDAKIPNWFHLNCFFKKQRPQSVGDVQNFEKIRLTDQQKIKKNIEKMSAVVLPTQEKRTKRNKSFPNAIKDFGIEYAASGRAACRGCEQKISKGEIRIKKVVFDTEVGMKFGGQALWHHVDCFAKLRNDLGYYVDGDQLPGFNSLSREDKATVKKQIPVVDVGEIPVAKKPKLEKKSAEEIAEERALDKKMTNQNKTFYKYRDSFQEVDTKIIKRLLTENNQILPEGREAMLDALADILSFGRLLPCKECKEGQYVFNNNGYICTGFLTEWTKCQNLNKEPERKKTVIPADIVKICPFLKDYKCKVEVRLIKYLPPSATTIAKRILKKEENAGPKIQREKPPLYNMEFFIIGNLSKSKEEIKEIITRLGGKLSKKLHKNLAAVISTSAEVEKMSIKMKNVQEMDIQVVPIEFLDETKSGDVISYIINKSICDWGSNPTTRILQEEKKIAKSIYERSVPKSMILKLKGGSVVDPNSGLADVAHVLEDNGTIYNDVLSQTDIKSGKNSYYKLQILKADDGNAFWVFRSWGRIGTSIGGQKVERMNSMYDALKYFKNVYLEKTLNEWDNRDNFSKQPGGYYPLDIDYGQEDNIKKITDNGNVKSKLHSSVQDLMKLIFDVDAMKKVMMEFELDLEKMPLGKISSKQIKKSYLVLTEISKLIETGGSNAKFIDASNRFYTLIPHSFGVNLPPVIDTAEEIKNKMDMLDSMLEIEIAYSMLVTETDENVNPIDARYEKLKTEIIPLERESHEFKTLYTYVKNTHAETHMMYELEVKEIFKVKRTGEEKRYKPFKKLHNRHLLWHGSRITNYAGILSHGLKIAPPEAPSTGYMFGKGIYFADMVSKSANYCATHKNNPTGLMLLCEVALGDMKECLNAEYVTKLPKDKHSIKGVGATFPNPTENIVWKDGVIIPAGKPVSKSIKSSLLYNEYIVYDVAQVNIQYLFKMDFKYKY